MENKKFKIPSAYFWTSAFLLLLLFFPAGLAANPVLSKSLREVSGKDTVRNVWVFFKNKPPQSSDCAAQVSPRALARRQRAGFKPNESGRPVNRRYIEEVEKLGGKLRHQFAWENAASFSVHASRLNEIAALPFVKSVAPVAIYARKNDGSGSGLAKRLCGGGYGWHLDMVNVKLAHEYLQAKRMGDPGSGALLAFFDSGFRFEHRAYSHARNNGLVIAARDFVDNDDSVSDPDSVVNDRWHPYHGNDIHGTQTLSLVAGYDPGNFIGVAWGARFAVARTEDIAVEVRQEEDNWAAAVVWADSIGADIISSSLGYRFFDDPLETYSYEDMDGKTTIVSRAAAHALSRGIIVVNSMGNYGRGYGVRSIVAPADVDGVIAVGAVDKSRTLANFSSIGPTSDGRVKPDLSAPGEDVPVVDVYSPGRASYRTNNGTSFSAPIVSGICALILQANPGINAAGAKERLYGSCKFGRGQTEVDTRYGRGIPDALLAVMGRDEIFIKITDSSGNGLAGAQVAANGFVYTANESGALVAKVSERALPLNLKVLFRNEEVGSFTVNSLPFVDSLALNIKLDDGLRVFPNVVKRNGILRARYLTWQSSASSQATAAVRTVSGRTIWTQKLQIQPDGSVEFSWDCKINGKRAAAGVYFLTIRHGSKMVSRKFVIA